MQDNEDKFDAIGHSEGIPTFTLVTEANERDNVQALPTKYENY